MSTEIKEDVKVAEPKQKIQVDLEVDTSIKDLGVNPYKFPSPTVSCFLVHLENICGVALMQSSPENNSLGYHVRGLSEKTL